MPPRSAPLPGPAPVTKNVMLGACGSGGGGAGCCWARAPDVTPSASAAMIIAFDLLISVLPRGYRCLGCLPGCCPFRHRNKRASVLFRQRGGMQHAEGAPIDRKGACSGG